MSLKADCPAIHGGKATRRAGIHALKRAVTENGSADAMLALLERSVRLGHKRLALLRCLQAERMGIEVRARLLLYCHEVAAEMPMAELERLATRSQRRYGRQESKRSAG